MSQSQRFLNSITSQLFDEYVWRLLTLLVVMTLLLGSNRALALVANPGATCQGITGAAQGSFLNSDYTSLVNALNTKEFVNIAGNDSGRIPLEIKISTVESSSNTTLSNFGIIDSGTYRAINIRRTFPNVAAYTDISLDFRNNITQQPIYLTNVALSAFDIDYANSNGNSFDDYLKITGVNEQGVIIPGVFQQISKSNITNFEDGLRTTSTYNCPAKDLGEACQGSIKFSDSVKSVNIRYTNTGRLTAKPTNQEIDFRVDNYCYVPEYIFSGTVFDDNGGIPENRANKDNADITTPSSVYTNRPKYFNGEYDPTFSETGIPGSTVRLTNCSNTSITYPTQSVLKNGAPVGEYQISIPKTTLGNNTNLCLIENRTGDTYPIRTSNENKNVGFTTTNYNYPDNNFGRVIPANAALVLRKAQFVNNCPSTLDYSAPTLNTPGNTDPRKGFSESGISDSDLVPGQCIAYRITATNRSNLIINDFIMQDKLQRKGVEGALVTSVLISPVFNSSDYASNSVVIGQNNPVITKPLVLPARDNKVFYFNTKYGTTVDP